MTKGTTQKKKTNTKTKMEHFGVEGQWTWPPSPPIRQYNLPPLTDPRWMLSTYNMNQIRQGLQMGWIVHPDGYHFMIDMAEWRRLTNYIEAIRRLQFQEANIINEAREHLRLQQLAQNKKKRKKQEEENQARLLEEQKSKKQKQTLSRGDRASRREQ